MYSIKYQVPGPGGDCSASKGPVNPIPGAPGAGCYGHHHSGSGIHGQHRRHTTAEVAPQVESDHKDPSGYPKLPKARRLGRVPTGPSSGAPCPYPYDASPECHSRTPYEPQIVRELLLKGSGIKAVFSLALLPRRPYMRESSCSVGGGVDSSNHQFPRQTDRGQEHRRPPSECKCVCKSVGSHWD